MTTYIPQKILPTIGASFQQLWQERQFLFHLAFIPSILASVVEVVINQFFKNQTYLVLGSVALSQWIFGISFWVGWTLFLHGKFQRTTPIIKIITQFRIQWRFIWRFLTFALIFTFIIAILLTIGNLFEQYILQKIPNWNSADYKPLFLTLPILLTTPFFFVALVDFILNNKFQPLMLIKNAYASYGKIFITQWLLAFIFFITIAAATFLIFAIGQIILQLLQVNNAEVISSVVSSSLSLSFLVSFLLHILTYGISSCQYFVAYQYWKNFKL